MMAFMPGQGWTIQTLNKGGAYGYLSAL